MFQASTNASEKQVPRAAPKSTLRQRGSHGPWRLVVVLAQSQPARSDVQRAWEIAVQELAHTDVELVYVEARALPAEGSGHPTALLNLYCTEIKAGKTAMTIVLGGGPAARFLVTATSSMRLPTLWIPHSHRDFIRQGRPAVYESRFGITSEEMGAAASALMHKAHWHAFTLVIDSSLLPVKDLLRKEHPFKSSSASSLTPRSVIYLPTDDRTLGTLLRRVAEENGRGSVIVLACDLNVARKVIGHAGKLEMLAGRFLWLWLDLKGELRLSEPNIIGSHVLHNARVSVTSDHMPPMEPESSPKVREPGPHLLSEHDISEHTLSNLAGEIQRMQEFHRRGDFIERSYRYKRDAQPAAAAGQQQQQQQSKQQPGFFSSSNSGSSSSSSSGNSGSSANSYEEDSSEEQHSNPVNSKSFMPLGMLALRPANSRLSGSGPESLLGRALRETTHALDRAMLDARPRLGRLSDTQIKELFVPECYSSVQGPLHDAKLALNANLTRRLREGVRVASKDKSEFHLLNLQGVLFPGNKTQLRWTKVGVVRSGRDVRLDTIIWPGGGIVPAYVEQGHEKIGMPSYKIVTALAPPFVMITDLQEGSCLRGLVCKQGNTLRCCYGYSMDLLYYVAQDLEFRFDLHVVKDGVFGRRRGRNGTWNGVIGELLTGKAQMAFAPLSVYSHRSQVVDFSSPYYFSSVSFLIAPKERNEISLLAFLQPFSTELWIAVVTSLNITAMFVACYEWFSPFGLNPWGRQRSKNFSIASALWVTWGLLCGHLVAFKAPKSWPNKFLINVWGGFSVIFVASYTANIAALIAGLFFHSTVNDYHERSLLQQRVGAPKSSAAEYYVQQANPRLWSYMSRYSVADVADGVHRLLNGSLDILIADTPIIDYYQLTDNGCRLEKIGDFIKEDTYGVGLSKNHPMTESISKVIANYTSTGLLDILQEKWYGGLPCMRGAAATTAVGYDGQPRTEGQPRPLGVASVAGVFCLLGLGMIVGIVILIGEHIFYKYSLPKLRQCPKNSIWRSRNVMFFSQKLYRFINCVELVSPHHAARELVHTVRQGQITSLFQKSVKRKEHEQRRRRKSKAQFFEMIQEIRRAQREEQRMEEALQQARGAIPKNPNRLYYEQAKSRSRSPNAYRSVATSPRQRSEKSRSSSNLGFIPIGTETSPTGPREFTLSSSNLRARSPLELVGRRLSHGNGEESPPPTPKLENLGGSPNLREPPRRGESMAGSTAPTPKQRSPAKRGQSFPAFATLRRPSATERPHYQVRSPLLSPNSELTFAIGRKLSREWGSGIDLSQITRSSETIATTSASAHVSYQEPLPEGRSRRRKKSQGDASQQMTRPVPARRSRSHENRDKHSAERQLGTAAKSVLGGQSTDAQAKRKLESELKAILTARAHHFELHPP